MGKGQIQVIGHKRRCAFEHPTRASEKEFVHGFMSPLCVNCFPGQQKIPIVSTSTSPTYCSAQRTPRTQDQIFCSTLHGLVAMSGQRTGLPLEIRC
jgi:hypothetical protein